MKKPKKKKMKKIFLKRKQSRSGRRAKCAPSFAARSNTRSTHLPALGRYRSTGEIARCRDTRRRRGAKKRKEKKTTTPQKTKQANKIKFTLLFNPFHFF